MGRQVVITGIGPLLPNCDGRDVFWKHLKAGDRQLTVISDPSDPERTVSVGRIGGFDPDKYLAEVPKRHLAGYSRELRFYLASLLLARDDARLDIDRVPGDRVGLYDGSSRGSVEFWDERIRLEADRSARDVYSRKDILNAINGQTVGIGAALFGVTGPTLAFAGSCTAGMIAAGQAYRDVADGQVDVAFATGHDNPLTPALFAMYCEAGLIGPRSVDPESATQTSGEDTGLAFSEGAITLVLEEGESARARGARVLGRIRGYRNGNEGGNPFTVDPTGECQARLRTRQEII